MVSFAGVLVVTDFLSFPAGHCITKITDLDTGMWIKNFILMPSVRYAMQHLARMSHLRCCKQKLLAFLALNFLSVCLSVSL